MLAISGLVCALWVGGDDAREALTALGVQVREVSSSDSSLSVDFHVRATECGDEALASVANLSEVVRLHLGGTQVSDDGLEHLSGLMSLTHLDLQKTAVRGLGLRHLAALPALEVLNLYGAASLEDAALDALADGFPALKRVYLWRSGVSREAAERLAFRRPGLQLDLGWAAEPLPNQYVPTEESRAAAAARIDELGGAVRRIALSSDAVEVDFHLGGQAISDADLRHLRDLPPVHELQLAGSAVTDDGMRWVGLLQGVERLHLERTAVSDAGLEALARLPNLTYLNLYGTNVTDEGLAALTEAKSLRSLFLWDTSVSWEAAALLQARLPDLEIDRGWDADGPPRYEAPTPEQTEAALARIEEVGGSVRRLDQASDDVEIDFHLGGKTLTDADLAVVRHVPHLVELHLGQTQITDAGLAHLAGLPDLERLNLQQTAVGDAGLVHLQGLRRLAYLNLYGTQVSDAGLDRLRVLGGLRSLYLWQSNATPEGAARLGEWLPGVQIHFGWDLDVGAETEQSGDG